MTRISQVFGFPVVDEQGSTSGSCGEQRSSLCPFCPTAWGQGWGGHSSTPGCPAAGGPQAAGQGSRAEVIVWITEVCLPFGRRLLGLPWDSSCGHSWGTEPASPGEQGEVKATQDQLHPTSPSPRRCQKSRCQGPWRHALASSTYLARAVPSRGILQAGQQVASVWRAQDTQGQRWV